MNWIFFLSALIMILIAFAFILPPLWRNYTINAVASSNEQERPNILIARQRLAELKQQKQAGVLNEADYREQFRELEQTLNADLSAASHLHPLKSQGRWIVYIAAILIPALTAGLYWRLGSFSLLTREGASTVAQPAAMPSAGDVDKMIDTLAARLQADPEDAQGWLLLGRSYKYREQYDKAVSAFANAYRLLGDQPEVMLLYAEALAYADNKNLAGKPAELIIKALSIEPNNINALWLGGLVRMQQNDIRGGLKLWRKLSDLLPPESEAQQQLQSVMTKMEVPEADSAPVKPPQSAGPAAARIDIQVDLAPNLRRAADPGATVFIYAQALAGPKMPLAIVHKQVSDLPVTVTLDDSLAMMPEIKLSNFDTVRLLARISKSGTAQAQPGDLIGMIERASVKAPGPGGSGHASPGHASPGQAGPGQAGTSPRYEIVIDSVVK